MATKKVVFFSGDSIMQDTGDTSFCAVGSGMGQRALWGDGSVVLAGINMARAGSFSGDFTGSGGGDVLAHWCQYTTIGVDETLTNDFGVNPGTAITAAAALTAVTNASVKMKNNGVLKFIRTKLGVSTSSASGNWISDIDQTPRTGWSSGNVVDQFNSGLSGLIGGSVDAVVDMAAWRSPTNQYVFVSTGANKYATPDGIHPTTVMHTALGGEIRATIDGIVFSGASIDTLDSEIYQNVPASFTTTGIDSPITGITFGGVTMSFSESGGDGTLTAPAWVDGLVQPLNHEQNYSVVITNASTSASAVSQYGVPAGLEHRTIPGTINTGANSLYQYSVFQSGYDAYIPDLGTGSIDEDGTFVDLEPGTYPGFWSRDLSYEMHPFTLVYAPTTPTAFKFIDVKNATASTVYTSNTITISGLAESVAVSVVGGTYSKNGGSFVSTAGTANNGDTFSVRLTTGTNPKDSFNSTLTVGTRSDTYTVDMPDANSGGGGNLGVTTRTITAR